MVLINLLIIKKLNLNYQLQYYILYLKYNQTNLIYNKYNIMEKMN